MAGRMIVTIDGPAGAGKSVAARALAERLGFEFLDTGAMYRAVTLAAIEQGLDGADAGAMAELARGLTIELVDSTVRLNTRDVTDAIRTSVITAQIHYAANNGAVREHLVGLQRAAAQDKNIVSEGRDQGTVVFPQAECKIFLTATPEERARRRLADLVAQGERTSLAEVLAKQNERDRSDEQRAVGPLVQARDAHTVVTDGLAPNEVVDRLETLVRTTTP